MKQKTGYLIPKAFLLKRLHSFMGIWLVLFLFEHLLTNSQAALFFGENGNGYVRMVNAIQNLPYLPLIEHFFIGIPLLIHGIYGFKILKTSKINSFNTDPKKPIQPYERNQAYSWQRITSWLLVIGILGHVIQMRIIDYPASAATGDHGSDYMVRVSVDKGLYMLAGRLGIQLFDQNKINEEESKISALELPKIKNIDPNENYDPEVESSIVKRDGILEQQQWLKTLKKNSLKGNEVIAVADSFGKASLLSIRETFKNPFFVVLYTLFVIASVYHAFNGLWTSLITWGIFVSKRAQKIALKFCFGLMLFVMFMGLAAIWGTYIVSEIV